MEQYTEKVNRSNGNQGSDGSQTIEPKISAFATSGDVLDRQSMKGLLLQRIEAKRREARLFIIRARKKRRLLNNTSIFCNYAASLVAVAAIVFARNVPVEWEVFCALTALFAGLAAAAKQITESDEIQSKLAQAELYDTKLEGIQIQLETTDVGAGRMTEQYVAVLTEAPFL